MNLDFYVISLNSSCSLVLEYNWLIQYNPLIDWVNRLINFCLSLWKNLAFSHIPANTLLASLSFPNTPLQLLDSIVSISASETSVFTSEQPNIAIIGTVVFLYTSKLSGFTKFELCLCSLDIQANSTKLAEPSDLFNVPSKYYEFANIFSKTKTEVLIPHSPYNLQINLEKDA